MQNQPIRGSGKWALITVCPDLIGMTHDPKVDRARSMDAFMWYVENLLVEDVGTDREAAVAQLRERLAMLTAVEPAGQMELGL